MPRVLYVHHRPQPSGAVRSLALLVGALDAAWDAHVLVPDGPAATVLGRGRRDGPPGPVPAFTHTWDVQYHGLRWLVLGSRARLAAGPRPPARSAAGRRSGPDIVHLNDSVLLASGWLAHRRGAKVVWHLRSSLAHGGRDRRSRWISRRLDEWGDAAIAIDSDVARTFPLRLRVEMVPNPVVVEPGTPSPVPRALGVPDGRSRSASSATYGSRRAGRSSSRRCGCWSTRARPSRSWSSAAACGRLRPFGASAAACCGRLGVPDEERDLRARVAELGLADRFTFVPFTTSPGAVYRALDVVVFPNQGAGLGRPVLEAAAYGKPVVASGSPDGAGLLIPDETGSC